MKTRKGFTLIELMVTITIMGIMTMIMIPAMRSFDKRNKVAAASEQLKSAILEARNYSMSPRFGDSNIDRYSVKIDDISAQPLEYQIGYCKPDVSVPKCPDTGWVTISTRRLPKDVTINTSYPMTAGSNVLEIGFKVPDSSLIFNNVYTSVNLSGWPAGNKGKSVISLCAASGCTGNNQRVEINSYTGLVNIL